MYKVDTVTVIAISQYKNNSAQISLVEHIIVLEFQCVLVDVLHNI